MDRPTKPLPANKPNVTFRHPDINRVIIAGQLLHDPPLRRTRKGVAVTNFIVVTQPDQVPVKQEGLEREPVYISIVVWAKQAVQCCKYLRKGSSVVIFGELQSMPNARPEEQYLPVQISAHWVQYLEKGAFHKITGAEEDEGGEEPMENSGEAGQ